MKFRLFNLEKKTALLVSIFLALFLLAFVKQCRAADFTFSGGVTMLRGQTETIGMRVTWPKVVANHADIEAGMQLIGASTWRGEQAGQAALLVQLVNGLGPVDFGIGPVVLQNLDAYNSGTFCFALTARYRITEHWRAEWLHISNAGTRSPNVGRDMALIGYRF